MGIGVTQFIKSMTITSILFVLLEMLTATVLPAFGFENFRPPFNILIILYLSFKLDLPYTGWLILYFQYIHSLFSIEGWGVGTLIGVFISLSITYMKELMTFTSAISTIITVQIFQIIWFIGLGLFLGLKSSYFANFANIILDFLPPSFFISLISPFVFSFLDKIWGLKENQGALN